MSALWFRMIAVMLSIGISAQVCGFGIITTNSRTALFVSAALEEKQVSQALDLSAKAAVLMCADTGEVLFEKNADEKLAIASITKIMTAVIALEYAAANDREIRFTSAMTAEGSSLYLQEGDVMKLSELVKGMMSVSGRVTEVRAEHLKKLDRSRMLSVSGNDAANAIAFGIAGGLDAFAELMNQKARQLGMTNTHFVTPSGLDHENHYSTAKDMAVLCCYAMRNREFADIVSQKSLTVQFVTPENKQQYCKNHNRLLSMYEGCIGIKTGFTKKAGRTLTSCAERNGVRLLAVTLNAPDDWNDHQRLYDHGFSCTTLFSAVSAEESYRLPVVGGEQNEVIVRPVCGCSLTVRNDADDHTNSPVKTSVLIPHSVDAPIEKGMVLGEIDVYYREKKISSVSLAAAEAIRIQKEEC